MSRFPEESYVSLLQSFGVWENQDVPGTRCSSGSGYFKFCTTLEVQGVLGGSG